MSGLYLDIGGTNFRWLYENETESLSGSFATDSGFLEKIEQLLIKYRPKRLGASFAGQVSDGKILSAPNISTSAIDFERYFSDKYQIECRIDNDLKCAVLAEAGARPDVKNMLLMYIGTGFGLGILSNGCIVRGANNLAGEIGHIPYKKSDFVCGCGGDDCLELFCSGKALEVRMRKLGFEEASLNDMLKSSREEIRSIIDDFSDSLRFAFDTCLSIFNPELVVFGGSVALNNIQLIDDITRKCSDKTAIRLSSQVRIEFSSMSNGSLNGTKRLFEI